jgi:hypothetical protein
MICYLVIGSLGMAVPFSATPGDIGWIEDAYGDKYIANVYFVIAAVVFGVQLLGWIAAMLLIRTYWIWSWRLYWRVIVPAILLFIASVIFNVSLIFAPPLLQGWVVESAFMTFCAAAVVIPLAVLLQ